ncbi:hypothetical protein Tco_1260043, partial [Tanacetum coccineum]
MWSDLSCHVSIEIMIKEYAEGLDAIHQNLIPKVSTSHRINDYCPISCCNVIYKCICKILTDRIIEGIKEVVSDNQSAFVPAQYDILLYYSGFLVKFLSQTRLFNRDCKFLVEKVKNRIGDWKNKSLSFAGRVQLCKSVISSMHVYWDSVLMIPTSILLDIEQLIRGFPWCNGKLKRGKAKVAWNDICLPKSEGGLGIRSLELFNIALMTTHIWNIVSNKEPLWVRWIHTYKLNARSFWDVPLKCDESGPCLSPSVADQNGCGSALFRRHSAFLQPISHLRTAVKRSSDDIRDIIMVTVRLKLPTFRFKNKAKVNEMLA